MCFRLLRGLYVCVYLCEHLALALSHLDSLRHAGETNTNALQAAGNVCLAWPLSWPHLPPLLLAITAPPQRQLLSLGPPLLQITVSGGDFFPFFFASLKRTFRCCWLLFPLILAVFFSANFEAAATLYLYS